MTNISKYKLSLKEEQKLFIQLSELLTTNSTTTRRLLDELLGYEEKMMIAKRFAIIALLWQKQSIYSIAQKLHVSTSTVKRIQIDYKIGRYKYILKLLGKPSVSFVGILNTLDNILHLGGIMPHYGKTHRSETYKRNNRY